MQCMACTEACTPLPLGCICVAPSPPRPPAATVEFLYIMETQEYCFLELNPRLQVGASTGLVVPGTCRPMQAGTRGHLGLVTCRHVGLRSPT